MNAFKVYDKFLIRLIFSIISSNKIGVGVSNYLLYLGRTKDKILMYSMLKISTKLSLTIEFYNHF